MKLADVACVEVRFLEKSRLIIVFWRKNDWAIIGARHSIDPVPKAMWLRAKAQNRLHYQGKAAALGAEYRETTFNQEFRVVDTTREG